MQVLLVEDQPKDLRIAENVATSAGFTNVEARSSAMAAKVLLETGLDGKIPLPDAIVLDLDLGYESGFELMRFWHSDPRLAKIPLIVWTVLGDEQREICRLFKVSAFVSKSEDVSLLRKALQRFAQAAAS
jgi:CheY-like chemotaxis protein